MNERIFQLLGFGGRVYIADRMSFREIKLAQGGSPKRCKVSATAQLLAHFVSDGAHVGSRGNTSAEGGTVAVHCKNFKFFDFYPNWGERDFFMLAGEFVRWYTVDFLGGKRRRHLLDDALKSGGQLATLFKCYFNWLGRGGWVAVCIVSIGREAKTDRAFVH